MILKYINEIIIRKVMNKDYEEIDEFEFRGDGQGDFETSSNCTDEKCILDYIKHCEEQIVLSEKYLRRAQK